MKEAKLFYALLLLLVLASCSSQSAQSSQPAKEKTAPSPRSANEKTITSEQSKIQVKVLAGNADVVSVKPYIKASKGKKEGPLWLDVVLKNTASEPKAYSVFGQAKTDSGGWLGGVSEAPEKGKLVPGKTTTAKIKTRYEGAEVPKEIRVEVLPAQ